MKEFTNSEGMKREGVNPLFFRGHLEDMIRLVMAARGFDRGKDRVTDYREIVAAVVESPPKIRLRGSGWI
jgi:hypothetical protein